MQERLRNLTRSLHREYECLLVVHRVQLWLRNLAELVGQGSHGSNTSKGCPHLIGVYDVGAIGVPSLAEYGASDAPALVLEYAAGGSVADHVQAMNATNPSFAVTVQITAVSRGAGAARMARRACSGSSGSSS
jgi:hypothetical protein